MLGSLATNNGFQKMKIMGQMLKSEDYGSNVKEVIIMNIMYNIQTLQVVIVAFSIWYIEIKCTLP